jgi:hypothetical protein
MLPDIPMCDQANAIDREKCWIDYHQAERIQHVLLAERHDALVDYVERALPPK